MHLPPGVTREVEVLKLGRPLALCDYFGWPGPDGDAKPPQHDKPGPTLGFVKLVAFAPPPFPPDYDSAASCTTISSMKCASTSPHET